MQGQQPQGSRNKDSRKQQMIEKIQQIQITQTEEKALIKVFDLMSNGKKYFDHKDVGRVLGFLGMNISKQQIDLMIWEVDEKLNHQIKYPQLLNLYKKCNKDESGLEPKSLFYMIQFLMFCQKDKYTVTVEDCLELIYVRLDKEKKDLQTEIEYIFGKGYDNIEDQEIEIDFKNYLDKVFKKSQDERRQREKNIQEKFKNAPDVIEKKNEN